MATTKSTIVQYYLAENVCINEFKNDRAVLGVYPNPAGTRYVIIDDANQGKRTITT